MEAYISKVEQTEAAVSSNRAATAAKENARSSNFVRSRSDSDGQVMRQSEDRIRRLLIRYVVTMSLMLGGVWPVSLPTSTGTVSGLCGIAQATNQ